MSSYYESLLTRMIWTACDLDPKNFESWLFSLKHKYFFQLLTFNISLGVKYKLFVFVFLLYHGYYLIFYLLISTTFWECIGPQSVSRDTIVYLVATYISRCNFQELEIYNAQLYEIQWYFLSYLNFNIHL